MSSTNSEDCEPQPLPFGAAPLPIQRTSSPSFDTFLDPQLSLTPERPQDAARVAGKGHKPRNGRGENKTARALHKGGGRGAPQRGANRTDGGKNSKDQCSDRVIVSNPGVLFQQERNNQQKIIEKQLRTIKQQQNDKSASGPKKDSRSKENKIAAKVNNLTKPSTILSSGSQVNKGSNPPLGKKSAISQHCGRGALSKGEQGHHGGSNNKKHVRIVDPKNPLSSPELHSTAALGHQIRQMGTHTFNAEEVVLKTLQESESARVTFGEKVAEAANVAKTEKKYSGLVSVGIPADEIIQRAVSQRKAQVRRRPTRPTKPSDVPPPDIVDMFSPSMIVESASLDASKLVPQKIKPEPVDPDMTFDLYRHMQCWDLGC